jgi:nitrogen fixation/metabolism regulation signal transduction histidine kinase
MIKSGSMVYRRFYAGIVVIALLMGLVSYAAAWSVYREYQLVTSVSLFLAWALMIAIMIRHVNRTNRELSSFLVTLQAGDTSNLFDTEGVRGLQKKLFTSFNTVILAFRELRIRKEQEQLLLQSTVDQTGAGILVLDPSGQVEICNMTFRELLNTGTFTRLGDLSESHPRLHRIIGEILPGEQQLVEFIISNPKSFEPDDRKQVVINAREIVIENRKLKVLTFQNIQYEIEQRESDAWEKLLRLFSHEIMN